MTKLLQPFNRSYMGQKPAGPDILIGYRFICPGCKSQHLIWVAEVEPGKGGAIWSFDGNLERPTFHPSVKITWGDPGFKCCHFFIKAGTLEYLADCTHDLAGKTVPMEPFAEAAA